MLIVAIVLGFIGQRVTSAGTAFFVLYLATAYGFAGISYFAFGSQALRWDESLQKRFFPPAKWPWLVLTFIGLGCALSLLAGALYWLLK